MSNSVDDNTLHIRATEIGSFRTVETHFRVPLVSDKESSASVRNVVIDNDYSFKGLCIEGLAYEVGSILDMQTGIVYDLVNS